MKKLILLGAIIGLLLHVAHPNRYTHGTTMRMLHTSTIKNVQMN